MLKNKSIVKYLQSLVTCVVYIQKHYMWSIITRVGNSYNVFPGVAHLLTFLCQDPESEACLQIFLVCPDIFYPTFFLLQLNPTYMKRILHFIWPPRFAYVGLYTHFSQVLTHEIGHSLGLLHSNVRSSIMWPYQQNMRDPKLGDNDIWRIQRHYGTGVGIGVVKTLSGISPGGQVGWRLVQFSA